MDSKDHSYPAHVVTANSTDFSETQLTDKICGSILCLCFVFGSTANIFAFMYFFRIKAKSLCEKLYCIISGFDFTTSIAQFPVMFSLWHHRKPLLFTSRLFCGVWVMIFEYLQRASIYLIVLLSVTRTLAIVRPFSVINERAVLLSLIPYTVLLFADLIIGMCFSKFSVAFYYLFDFGYPIRGFKYLDNRTDLTPEQNSFMKIQNWIYSIEVILPSIIIFISFALALGRLQTVPKETSSEKKVHRASVTIALATALFLTLNLPFFLMLSIQIYDDNRTEEDQKILPKQETVSVHIWPIAKVLFVTLNASLNPVLYFFRIGTFRRWLASLFGCVKVRTASYDELFIAETRIEREVMNDSPLSLKNRTITLSSIATTHAVLLRSKTAHRLPHHPYGRNHKHSSSTPIIRLNSPRHLTSPHLRSPRKPRQVQTTV